MTYPSLTSQRQRRDAAYEFHCARSMFRFLQDSERKPLKSYETPELRDRVHAQLRSEARSKLRGMRQMLHALFD